MGTESVDLVAKWLVAIGALNWGLTGVGGLVGSNLNVVNIALGGLSAAVENLVYVAVGLAALYGIYGMVKK
jgi:uncharacterized membrane protein YuzA (DUF378 family)